MTDHLFVISVPKIPHVDGQSGKEAEARFAFSAEVLLRKWWDEDLPPTSFARGSLRVRPAMEAIDDLLDFALDSSQAQAGRHRARLVMMPPPRSTEDVELPPL